MRMVSYGFWGGSLIHNYAHTVAVANPNTRIQIVDGEFVMDQTPITKYTGLNPSKLLTLTDGGAHLDIAIEDLHRTRNQ